MDKAGHSSHIISARRTDGRSSVAPSLRATQVCRRYFIVGTVGPERSAR